MHIEGSCHCGRVTFTAEIDPSRVMVCHCTDCQVLSGSAYRVIVPARSETFVLHGEPKHYVKTAESGAQRTQAFCPECGTPLFGAAVENATHVTIRVGCIKQRAELTPQVQLWKRSCLPWVGIVSDLPGSVEQQAFRAAPAASSS